MPIATIDLVGLGTWRSSGSASAVGLARKPVGRASISEQSSQPPFRSPLGWVHAAICAGRGVAHTSISARAYFPRNARQLGTPIALFRWGQREVARCNGSPPSVRRAASCSNQAATCHDPPAALFSRNSRDFWVFGIFLGRERCMAPTISSWLLGSKNWKPRIAIRTGFLPFDEG
jgi:hypothetical protein